VPEKWPGKINVRSNRVEIKKGVKSRKDLVPALSVEHFEALYAKYNRREYVHPDPLEFLYDYPDPADREIVGLIASSLAYGAVMQILKTIGIVLERIGEPHKFVTNASRSRIGRTFGDFRYRFTSGEDIAALLYGIGLLVRKHGSLEKCFLSGYAEEDDNIINALTKFVGEFEDVTGYELGHLLPRPSRGSACKRLNLFLRWMVRSDDVDPGGWYTVDPGKLLTPIDIHMFRTCCALSMTARKQADLRTAVEITEAFRTISPRDPVKYDFAITRLGIREELDPAGFIQMCNHNMV